MNKNPLPLLLTSAGLVWLVASSRRSSSSRFEGASSSPRSGDFNRATQSFEDATYEGSSRMKRAASQIRQRASRTYGATRERTYEVGRNLNGIVQEQPLVCGAIALAVGAVIGAAIPASRFERDLVARARESAGPLLDEMSQSLQGAGTADTSTSASSSAASSQTSH